MEKCLVSKCEQLEITKQALADAHEIESLQDAIFIIPVGVALFQYRILALQDSRKGAL